MAKPKPSKRVFANPAPAELEMILDAADGKPLKRPPSQGVIDMKERIKLLTGQMRRILQQMEQPQNAIHRQKLNQIYLQLKLELREAKDRRAEYQLQHQSPN